jgi:TatD DNase family protein
MHSYSGPKELVPRYAGLGLSFGFSAAVGREGGRKVTQALLAVPSDRLLLETDAPDQPGAALRASGNDRNEPAELLTVANQVAATLGISADALATLTTANAERLFSRR